MAANMIKNLCRFCMKAVTGKGIHFTKNQSTNLKTIQEMLNIFTDLNGFEKIQNKFPKFVCQTCHESLINSYKFHQQCQETFKKYTDTITNTKKSEIVERINSKIQRNKSQSIQSKQQFKCCNKTFVHELHYQRHIKLAHFARKLTICRICSAKFYSYRGLILHKAKHKIVKMELCNFCDEKHSKSASRLQCLKLNNVCYYCNRGFLDGKSRKVHLLEKHNKETPITCIFCEKTCKSKLILLRHYRTYHSEKLNIFFCDICNGSIEYSLKSLKAHLNEEHLKNTLEKPPGQNENSFNFNANSTSDQMIEEFLDETIEFSNTNYGIFVDEPEVKTTIADKTDKTQLYHCPKCREQFSILKDLFIHLAHSHKDMVLICNECGASFNELSLLTKHRREHEQDNQLVDMITAIDQRAEEIQLIENNDHVLYVCKLCDEKFKRKSNIDEHNCKFYKHQEIQFQCTNCTEVFPSLLEMYKHRKRHKSEGFFCSLCDRQFSTIRGLKYHLKTHTGVKEFECPFCQRKFTAKTNLNSHIRTLHSNFKSIDCGDCDRQFTTVDHLIKHKRSVHDKERKYVCSECDKAYLQRSHLVHHMWTHTGVKQHCCDFCEKSYTSRNSVKKHMMKVHLFNNF